MFLSLPLPMKKTRTIMVTLIRAHPQDIPMMVRLSYTELFIAVSLCIDPQVLEFFQIRALNH